MRCIGIVFAHYLGMTFYQLPLIPYKEKESLENQVLYVTLLITTFFSHLSRSCQEASSSANLMKKMKLYLLHSLAMTTNVQTLQ